MMTAFWDSLRMRVDSSLNNSLKLSTLEPKLTPVVSVITVVVQVSQKMVSIKKL